MKGSKILAIQKYGTGFSQKCTSNYSRNWMHLLECALSTLAFFDWELRNPYNSSPLSARLSSIPLWGVVDKTQPVNISSLSSSVERAVESYRSKTTSEKSRSRWLFRCVGALAFYYCSADCNFFEHHAHNISVFRWRLVAPSDSAKRFKSLDDVFIFTILPKNNQTGNSVRLVA